MQYNVAASPSIFFKAKLIRFGQTCRLGRYLVKFWVKLGQIWFDLGTSKKFVLLRLCQSVYYSSSV